MSEDRQPDCSVCGSTDPCPGGETVERAGGCPLCVTASGSVRRAVHVLLAVALGLALTGYFVGMRQTATGASANTAVPDASHPPAPLGAVAAVPYGEMNARSRGPNREWINSLEKLANRTPGLLEPVTVTEQQKLEALALRAQRRAYDGAPPVVPHPVDQMTASSCVACHGEGLRVGETIAPRMSHQLYASCTQCHVESENRSVPPSGAWPANLFIGSAGPTCGERAWQGAPPTVPHATQMRSDCMSCHGVNGHAGLRSTHPWRQNCLQCHAPGAELDQQPIPQFPEFLTGANP